MQATQNSCNAVTRAERHQAAVLLAIQAVFNLDPAPFAAIQRGGSRVLEKVVRAYHYWAEEHPPSGICPYDHPRRGYFRMSPKAKQADVEEKLHCEHAVPIRRLVYELSELRQTSSLPLEAVARVMRANEVIVVTKTEASLLDKRYKSRMPDDWSLTHSHLRRLELVLGISEDDLRGTRLVGPCTDAA